MAAIQECITALPVSHEEPTPPRASAAGRGAAPVSVIVVSWNARHHLRNCLASIRRECAPLVREVIVVDNDSADGSPEMVEQEFPEVTLVRAGRNLGFAGGNNLAMERAAGPLLALVNSDVVVHPGCMQRLVEQLDSHPEVALVGPCIVGADARVQGTCRRLPSVWNNACRALGLDLLFPGVPFLSSHEMRHFRHDVRLEPEVVSGCFWMVRKSAVRAVGPLDERYFFYMEDVDWCRRFREGGWRLVFLPDARATHFGGGSTANAPIRYSIQYHRSNLTYWDKYHGAAGRAGYRALAVTHHFLRMVVRAARRGLRLGVTDASRHKLREDVACLRWLLTGRVVE